MGIAFSNIGTVGREQLITSGSNGEPNWSYIPSKGKSTKTQTEFVSEIKKLAQKAANATDKTDGYGGSIPNNIKKGNRSAVENKPDDQE